MLGDDGTIFHNVTLINGLVLLQIVGDNVGTPCKLCAGCQSL